MAISRPSLIAMALLLTSCATPSPAPTTKQGWTRDEQLRWYHGNQGSRLVPAAWMVALEAAGSTEPFFTIKRMQDFGYLAPDADDKTGLPIGFSKDYSDDRPFTRTQLHWVTGQKPNEPWIGMNCAACHTGEINDGDKKLRIEGGPSMGDFQRFIEQLDLALDATLADPAKFQRFAAKVLGTNQAADSGHLHDALAKLSAWEHRIKDANDPALPGRSTVRYGHARLDAVGHILNKVGVVATYEAPAGSPPQFTAAADAPVSYPFIWNIQQHDRVQWNGIAPNKGLKLPSGQIFDVGALGRNTGEVIGVFADVVARPKAGIIKGYVSSVNVTNLDAMEVLLAKLEPPRWPSQFGVPKAEQIETGRVLFAAHCQECHALLPRIAGPGGSERPDLKTPIKAVMTPIFGLGGVGTDPWMACNAFTFRSRTGALQGTPDSFVTGTPFTEIADSRQMLVATIAGSLAGKKRQLAGTFAKALFGIPRVIGPSAGFAVPETAQKSPQARLAICQANAANELIAYKGRPLTGIWATAPYLHNGSVRSLYELLLPPSRRATSFPVGTRLLDPVKVGYVEAGAKAPTTFTVNDARGVPIPGNSNAGHDYGNAALTPAQRQALVDYMKTL